MRPDFEAARYEIRTLSLSLSLSLFFPSPATNQQAHPCYSREGTTPLMEKNHPGMITCLRTNAIQAMVQAASVWRRKFVRRVSCFSGRGERRGGGGRKKRVAPLHLPIFPWKNRAGAKFRSGAGSISLEIYARTRNRRSVATIRSSGWVWGTIVRISWHSVW